MAGRTASDPKEEALRATRTLNPRPEAVADAVFTASEFCDPRDLVQVKYEMVRRVRVDKVPAARAARYEELRTAIAGGTGEGWRLGRGVLAAKGMAAWATAWQSLPEPAARLAPGHRPPGLPSDSDELVRVLAAMALAHIHLPDEAAGTTMHISKGVDAAHGRDRGGGEGDPRASAA
ncbi:hypothetical protein ABT187_47170 [Streptomyces sp. NPDC001817]|uniref:hypothetical protein n=1 Tax=Streptomyces sp. NPDC001817 TaxID=3154398 RepID=UPI00332D81AA